LWLPLLFLTGVTGVPVQEAPSAGQAASQTQARRPATDQTIPVPKGTRLTLTNDGGEIVVKTWDRDAVRVQAIHSSRMQVKAELKDQVLVVEGGSDRPSTSIDYDLTIPAWMNIRLQNRYSDIEVDGVAGSVSVESIEGDLTLRNLTGQVTAKTIEGKILLEGGRGKVQLTTIEGDVSVTKASGDLTIDSNDGDVTLTDLQASALSVSTVDGDISFTGNLPASAVYDFTSHDGDVSLTVPETTSATFGVRSYGDENQVHTTFTLKPVGQIRKGRRVVYTLGGGAAQVEIETFDGSIYLRKPGEKVKKEL